MSDSKNEKGILIEKAIHAGLGNEKFLQGVSLENLESMVKAIEDRDGEIDILKKTQVAQEEKPENVTTVSDLIRKGKVRVSSVFPEVKDKKPEEKEKGGKDEKSNKA